MISVEEKLAVFTQYLLKKQRGKGKETIDGAKRKKENLLIKADETVKEDKRTIEERSYHVIYRDKNKIIAQGKNTAKNQLLEEKSKLLDDFKKTIWEVSHEYVGTPIYKDYLRRCLSRIPEIFGDCKQLKVFALPEDHDFILEESKKILKGYDLYFDDVSIKIIKGGIIVREMDNRLNCDFSIVNLIRDNGKIIGMQLSKIMDKDEEAVT